MLYDSESSPLWVEGLRRFTVFDHCRLLNIGIIWRVNFVVSSEIWHKVVDPRAQSLEQRVNVSRLNCS